MSTTLLYMFFVSFHFYSWFSILMRLLLIGWMLKNKLKRTAVCLCTYDEEQKHQDKKERRCFNSIQIAVVRWNNKKIKQISVRCLYIQFSNFSLQFFFSICYYRFPSIALQKAFLSVFFLLYPFHSILIYFVRVSQIEWMVWCWEVGMLIFFNFMFSIRCSVFCLWQ